MGRFDEMHWRSLDDPETFWSEGAAAIDWDEPWASARRLAGAVLPMVHRRAPEHVPQRARPPRRERSGGSARTDLRLPGDRYTGNVDRELRDAVVRVAGALVAEGVGRGLRVIVYMPMVPEAVISMLACARIPARCTRSSSAGSRRTSSRPHRRREAQGDRVGVVRIEPSGLVPYKPLLDAAIAMVESKPSVASSSSDRCSRPSSSPAETSTGGGLSPADPVDCVPVDATDPLYILYTSGTTGQPKGIVRDNGGHAVALAWTMKHIYDVARRGLLGCIRRRLGRRALVHRVRAPPARLHDGALRREAGRHARRRRFLRA